jgi:hypothetical protein
MMLVLAERRRWSLRRDGVGSSLGEDHFASKTFDDHIFQIQIAGHTAERRPAAVRREVV